MSRFTLLLLCVALALSGCATSHYYNTRIAGVQTTPAFVSTLDAFLRKEGLVPYEELYPKQTPELYAAVTHGEKRWDKNFKFTWPAQGGFVAVSLVKDADGITLSVGGSSNREKETGELAGALKEWLSVSYPKSTVSQQRESFVDLR